MALNENYCPMGQSNSTFNRNDGAYGIPSAAVGVIDDNAGHNQRLKGWLEARQLEALLYESAEEYIEQSNHHLILFVEVHLPGISGLELLQRHRGATSLPLTVAMAEHPSCDSIVAAMRAGAVTFLSKPISEFDFGQAVSDARSMAESIRSRQLRRDNARQLLMSLSSSERDTLQLLLEGKPNKSIARQLGISLRTVTLHRSSILRKLEMRSIVQVARLLAAAEDYPRDTFGQDHPAGMLTQPPNGESHGVAESGLPLSGTEDSDGNIYHLKPR